MARLFYRFSLLLLPWLLASVALAGPFTEPGIDKDDPAIVAWAATYADYLPAADVDEQWRDPAKALGPAAGNLYDVVSLGERPDGDDGAPGQITLGFAEPLADRPGDDFAVFENSFPTVGLLFAELAFVEVGTDGENWARFPSVSLTSGPVDEYGALDPTDIYNLAGKHQNAYGIYLGTPFDLADLSGHPAVTAGLVDLQEINWVRLVDIPGGGLYSDEATALGYDADHPIYDVFPTTGSAGFDVEAVAVIDETNPAVDDDDDSGDDDTGDGWYEDDDTADDDADDDADNSGAGCS